MFAIMYTSFEFISLDGKNTMFKFKDNYSNFFSRVQIIWICMVDVRSNVKSVFMQKLNNDRADGFFHLFLIMRYNYCLLWVWGEDKSKTFPQSPLWIMRFAEWCQTVISRIWIFYPHRNSHDRSLRASLFFLKKYISSSSELLSKNSLFGGQLWRRSNHECEVRVIYLLATDRQTMNYYLTIHTLELIYFDSNKQETRKKQLYPSDSSNISSLHWRNIAKGMTVR